MRTLSICVALIALAPLGTWANTYKCTQPDGKVAFQDRPCVDGASSAVIDVRPTPPSSTPQEQAKARDAAQKRNAAAQQQRDEEARIAKEKQAQAQERQSRCTAARQSLEALNAQRPVFRFDAKGAREYVPDSARQAETDAAQKAIAANC